MGERGMGTYPCAKKLRMELASSGIDLSVSMLVLYDCDGRRAVRGRKLGSLRCVY